MALSHYLPAFTSERGLGQYKQQRAVCGLWINPMSDHDAEPTCPECLRWCEANTAEAEALAAKWEAEDNTRHEPTSVGGKQ